LHTANSIQIRAPRERIFQFLQDIPRWPEYLPHYRAVRELGPDHVSRPVFEMTIRRSGIPITWKKVCDIDGTALELRFEHLDGWTKGMKEIWTLTPTRDGTRAEIVHDLDFRVRALSWVAEPVLGRFFISHIAQRTLETLKQVIEQSPDGAQSK
jgi:ribosome-associated toxin RatA of RatAB toxin-antitoxin module